MSTTLAYSVSRNNRTLVSSTLRASLLSVEPLSSLDIHSRLLSPDSNLYPRLSLRCPLEALPLKALPHSTLLQCRQPYLQEFPKQAASTSTLLVSVWDQPHSTLTLVVSYLSQSRQQEFPQISLP